MSVNKVIHKGKTVLYIDYRGLNNPAQQIQNLDELTQILKKSPVSLAIYSNFENVSVGIEFMNRVKAFGIECKPKIYRNAVIGATGLKKILIQGYVKVTGDTVNTFDTEAEALDWVIS